MTPSTRTIRYVLAALSTLLWISPAAPASAQSAEAQITGTVRDTSGAPVPG